MSLFTGTVTVGHATASIFQPKDKDAVLCRSYGEAQWLAALDHAGIEWVFEPQYYEKPNCGSKFEYLPDIFLPNEGVFIEVKGDINWRENSNAKYRRTYTDPFCLWQQANEGNFDLMRERLHKPLVQGEFELDDITAGPRVSKPFTDVWVVGGGFGLQTNKVATYSMFPAGGPDCESCNSLDAIRQMVFSVQELGICPDCGKLSFIWPGRKEEFGRTELTTKLSCYHCGWEGKLQAPKGIYYSAFQKWSAALEHASDSKKNGIYDAAATDSSKTHYSYETKEGTKTLTVSPDRFTVRRG